MNRVEQDEVLKALAKLVIWLSQNGRKDDAANIHLIMKDNINMHIKLKEIESGKANSN